MIGISDLPTVNASLNLTSAVLIGTGFYFIRQNFPDEALTIDHQSHCIGCSELRLPPRPRPVLDQLELPRYPPGFDRMVRHEV